MGLLLTRPVRLPRAVASTLGLVAAASLWIYLTHWTVYVPLEDAGHQWWALLGASSRSGSAVHLGSSACAVPASRTGQLVLTGRRKAGARVTR